MLQRAALPALENIILDDNHSLDDAMRLVHSACAGACQRGRMLVLLSAENDRCAAAAKRFLAKDGDRAVMNRTLGFMHAWDRDRVATRRTLRFILP